MQKYFQSDRHVCIIQMSRSVISHKLLAQYVKNKHYVFLHAFTSFCLKWNLLWYWASDGCLFHFCNVNFSLAVFRMCIHKKSGLEFPTSRLIWVELHGIILIPFLMKSYVLFFSECEYQIMWGMVVRRYCSSEFCCKYKLFSDDVWWNSISGTIPIYVIHQVFLPCIPLAIMYKTLARIFSSNKRSFKFSFFSLHGRRTQLTKNFPRCFLFLI